MNSKAHNHRKRFITRKPSSTLVHIWNYAANRGDKIRLAKTLQRNSIHLWPCRLAQPVWRGFIKKLLLKSVVGIQYNATAYGQ